MPDQVSEFLQKAHAITSDAPRDGNQPKVPFPSSMQLTLDQETKMITHAFRRMAELEIESGRDRCLGPTWWSSSFGRWTSATSSQGMSNPYETFLGKRSRFEATFLNQMAWRTFADPLSIFVKSNMSIPLVRRICRQMIARAKNAFFSSEPWFSVDPAPVPGSSQKTPPAPGESPQPSNDELAERIERFCRFKLHEAESRANKEEAISRALILGECAVYTYYVVRDQLFNVDAEVLIDASSGNPIRAADGNHITKGDQFVDAEDGTGQEVLARDGQTPKPIAPIYQKIPLDRRQVLFEGAKSDVIPYKDILIPTTAKDVQTADIVIHFYDKQVMEFIDLVVKRGMIGGETKERLGATQKMVALIKQMSDNSGAPKAAANQNLNPSENNNSGENKSAGPVAELVDFWMRFDANEDGIAESIYLICDKKSKAPIYYENVANVTTDGLRPIEIVRINPVPDRWYGQGIMELFEPYGTMTDLLINRWNNGQSQSGNTIFWKPSNTVEGDNNPNLVMQMGKTYTLKPGATPEETLHVVPVVDMKFDQTHTMTQFIMQLAMNESGVTNNNDNQAAGSESSKLATGIIDIQKSGDELFKPIIQDLRVPLERLINREIDVELANMNPEEAFTYLKGDALGVDTLTPEDVRGLRFKVSVELTALKDAAEIQMIAQVIAIMEKFYLLSPSTQVKLAPAYKAQLRKLDPKLDVDVAIVPDQPQPAPKDPTKTAVSVTVKGENLSPLERAGVMEKIGINETPEQAASAPPIKPAGDGAKKPGSNGASHKLGNPGPAGGTQHVMQLTQSGTRK